MIPRAFHDVLNPASIIIVSLIFLSTAGYVSAQTSLEPLQSCGVRKAYAVIINLLAVYASHILTIKVEPGLGISDTILRYAMAALMPSSSAKIPINDLIFLWTSRSPGEVDPIHRRMQKAINCGAVCVRFKKQDKPHGVNLLSPTRVVRAKPLREGNGEDEVFISVPRGTPASLFVPTMIQSSSAAMKALVGAIQLIFATLQLLSVSDPRVAAYGYGAFTYTIIPFALGSIINLIAVLCTGNYVDLTEVEIIDPGAANDIQWGHDGLLRLEPYGIPVALVGVMFFEFAVYLAIVGGLTRFSSGISTRSQRGWFLSWALFGTVYGYAFDYQPQFLRRFLRRFIGGEEGEVANILRMYKAITDIILDNVIGRILLVSPIWTPTVGGVVAMIQQYLHLFQC